MSYRVGTPNFNLPQTEGTDKRDWSDTNEAFLAVDSALKTAGDNASSAGSAASSAQTRADDAYTLATTANTAAGIAATAAASAGELAQVAKNKADDALPKANVVNTLTTTDSGYALDARQGKVLGDKLTTSQFTITWSGVSGIEGRSVKNGQIRNINLYLDLTSAISSETQIGTISSGDRASTDIVVPALTGAGHICLVALRTTGSVTVIPLSGTLGSGERIFIDATYVI